MFKLFFCMIILIIFVSANAQNLTKDVIDFCWKDEPESCGAEGECILQPSGNRCLCRDGFMGRGCLRPCQDIYKSCERWLEERRCEWAKPISPFFFDNCPLTCGRCKKGSKKLRLPLPPILEPLSWIIGEMFSVKAIDMINGNEHVEVGFMTGKPFREDTGFAVKDKPKTGDNLVAIETVGNNGLIIIEEGILLPDEIRLSIRYQKAYTVSPIKEGSRTFRLVTPHILEERVKLEFTDGKIQKFRKKYVKVFDYLQDYV